MRLRVVAAATVFVAGACAGVLIEHYVGTAALIDWGALRYAILLHQFRPVHERAEVPLATLPASGTMVALVFGQSNAANAGETPGPQHAAVYEYFRGRLYGARDPLLGATGDGGSIWLRLAGRAVDSGSFQAVVLVPFAVGSSEIARWAPQGSLHSALLATIEQAQRSGLRFTHLLWQQGEADAMAGTAETDYQRNFLAMLAAIRQLGVDAPVYVASSTRCGKTRPSASVRHAQLALNDSSVGIFAGPDTDALGLAERYDGCHFSTEGLEKAASLWWAAVRPAPAN